MTTCNGNQTFVDFSHLFLSFATTCSHQIKVGFRHETIIHANNIQKEGLCLAKRIFQKCMRNILVEPADRQYNDIKISKNAIGVTSHTLTVFKGNVKNIALRLT